MYNTGNNVSFVSHSDLDPRKCFLFLYASIHFVVVYQCYFAAQPNRLNNGRFEHVLEKGSEYRWEITWEQQKGQNGNDVRFTWNLLKKYCVLPLQCKITLLHEKPSSTGNLKEGATYSLLTCYFVNLPHISNGELMSLPFCRRSVFCEWITA